MVNQLNVVEQKNPNKERELKHIELNGVDIKTRISCLKRKGVLQTVLGVDSAQVRCADSDAASARPYTSDQHCVA